MQHGRPGVAAEGRGGNLLLIGFSYRSTTVLELERLSGDADRGEILAMVQRSPQVTEVMVLATCNRLEVYAVVDTFQGGLSAIGQILAERAGTTIGDLVEGAYVRRGEEAARHLFRVAGGLDSAVKGDQQVLGQLRRAYATAKAQHSVGSVLHKLLQRALATGKRVRCETTIGAAYASTVAAALNLADKSLADSPSGTNLEGKTAVVIGTGAMGTLAAAHLTHAGCRRIHVLSRSSSRGRSLVTRIREAGTQADLLNPDRIPETLAQADILFSGTTSAEPIVTAADVRAALSAANGAGRLVICDIGMPRNVDPAVADLPGVSVVDLERICHEPGATDGVEAASRIIAAEFSAYLAEQRMTALAPTITALHRRAAEVVESELSRLDHRLPELGCAYRDEMARTVRRVVDKLLHPPTTQIKNLAGTPAGAGYAEALRKLFELEHVPTGKVLG
ncbi:MAG: glutamyl-tRNA reductase [Mycolicibacterium sp.]|uniref:glutamyl-tRNA reductase n=1 Tax=Mycolicibacterium sp. TaxID=2320850 RepID=UPI003D0DE827